MYSIKPLKTGLKLKFTNHIHNHEANLKEHEIKYDYYVFKVEKRRYVLVETDKNYNKINNPQKIFIDEFEIKEFANLFYEFYCE